MERIQDNVTFGLLNHAALDYAVDRILGLPVEFGKVVNSSVYFHILNEQSINRFYLLHRATVETLVIIMEHHSHLVFYVNIIFHWRRNVCMQE